MNREEYSDEANSLINQFKKEATRQGYDESWINKIMRDATSRNSWYLMTTLMFNLQLLEEGDDRTEDK